MAESRMGKNVKVPIAKRMTREREELEEKEKNALVDSRLVSITAIREIRKWNELELWAAVAFLRGRRPHPANVTLDAGQKQTRVQRLLAIR